MVPTILPVHILAGTLALVFGYIALSATKGATLHRRSGIFFVAAMVTLSLTGALIAVLNGSPGLGGRGVADVLFRDDSTADGQAAPDAVAVDRSRRHVVRPDGRNSRLQDRL